MLYSIKSTIDDTVLYSSNDIDVIRESQPAYKNSYISYSQEAIDMINNKSLEVIKAKGEVLLVNNDTSDIFLVSSDMAKIRNNMFALTLGAYNYEDV